MSGAGSCCTETSAAPESDPAPVLLLSCQLPGASGVGLGAVGADSAEGCVPVEPGSSVPLVAVPDVSVSAGSLADGAVSAGLVGAVEAVSAMARASAAGAAAASSAAVVCGAGSMAGGLATEVAITRAAVVAVPAAAASPARARRARRARRLAASRRILRRMARRRARRTRRTRARRRRMIAEIRRRRAARAAMVKPPVLRRQRCLTCGRCAVYWTIGRHRRLSRSEPSGDARQTIEGTATGCESSLSEYSLCCVPLSRFRTPRAWPPAGAGAVGRTRRAVPSRLAARAKPGRLPAWPGVL